MQPADLNVLTLNFHAYFGELAHHITSSRFTNWHSVYFLYYL